MTAANPADRPRASARDWIAVISCMLGAFLAILDIQITNASLRDIEGSIGASASEGGWISTSYLTAEIIAIPLTGWLARVFGMRRYLLWNVVAFLLFSVACGMSRSLPEMMLFRAGQGFTGGVLIPTALTVLRQRLPLWQQPIGVSIFGFAATFSPTIGPTVGGWVTAAFSWHYVFYLNLIPGLLALFMLGISLDKAKTNLRILADGDWLAIALVAIGLASLTILLEEGERWEWFDSDIVRVLAATSVIGLAGFIWRGLTVHNPLVDLKILRDPKIASICLLMTAVGGVAFGSTYIIPLYCGQIQGYSPMQIGSVVMWVGLPQLFLFPMMPWMLRTFDARLMIASGTLLYGFSCWINTALTQDVGLTQLILPQILRGLGMPLITGPMNQLLTTAVSREKMPDASSISTMLRNLGGSICIATISTITDRREHFHFSILAERLTHNTILLQQRLAQLTLLTGSRQAALAMLAGAVRKQAYLMSFSDAFALTGGAIVACLGAFVFFRTAPGATSQSAQVARPRR